MAGFSKTLSYGEEVFFRNRTGSVMWDTLFSNTLRDVCEHIQYSSLWNLMAVTAWKVTLERARVEISQQIGKRASACMGEADGRTGGDCRKERS